MKSPAGLKKMRYLDTESWCAGSAKSATITAIDPANMNAAAKSLFEAPPTLLLTSKVMPTSPFPIAMIHCIANEGASISFKFGIEQAHGIIHKAFGRRRWRLVASVLDEQLFKATGLKADQ